MDELQISYFAHEGEMARMERIVRLFATVTISSLAVTLAVVLINML